MAVKFSRKRAIREKCLDCCAGSRHEVKICHITNCPLWAFRMGYEVTADGSKVRKNTQNKATTGFTHDSIYPNEDDD